MSVARALPRAMRSSRVLITRKYASHAAEKPAGYVPTGEEWIAQRQAIKTHANAFLTSLVSSDIETSELWRRISFFACVPGVFLLALYVKQVEDEHHEHMEHVKAELGGEIPKPDYAWLGKRAKPFPWGNNSLFFNPEANRNFEKDE
ncbi:cytochrome c oxidase, subunit VIa [Cantharellus anzutake]|uniref:cytochrome c oxidase, subunit VIa n=1 Tax=Cantharellus anzutake TaxID=1750568 RepID=UPI0019060A51|nr:cytochrome c oxidase, subunit VIa [Cantharellus anzutake]KAF8331502.1 cytochrome c oxidase, subunit VIa [Cantharellus anzutake]